MVCRRGVCRSCVCGWRGGEGGREFDENYCLVHAIYGLVVRQRESGCVAELVVECVPPREEAKTDDNKR